MSICNSGARCVSCGGDDCGYRKTLLPEEGHLEKVRIQVLRQKLTYNPGFGGRYNNAGDIVGAIQDVAMGKSSAQAVWSLAKTGQIPDLITPRPTGNLSCSIGHWRLRSVGTTA